MASHKGSLNSWLGLLLAAGVSIASSSAMAGDRDDHGGSFWREGGWGSHPTLPVPGALVFGGIAVSVAAAVARRRRKTGGDGKAVVSDQSDPRDQRG